MFGFVNQLLNEIMLQFNTVHELKKGYILIITKEFKKFKTKNKF